MPFVVFVDCNTRYLGYRQINCHRKGLALQQLSAEIEIELVRMGLSFI